MKCLCITYKMSIDHSRPSDDYPHNIETIETCITLSMLDEMADDILDNQSESQYLDSWNGRRNVSNVLMDLAYIQGYTTASFCHAEPVE